MGLNDRQGYNTTKKERHLSVAAGFAIKLKQEKQFKSDLRSHFKDLAKEVGKTYAKNGKLPSFDDHKNATQKIINKHYIELASKSSKTIRENFKSLKKEDNEIVDALLDKRIKKDAKERSAFAAESIANTTRDNIKSYVKEAIADSAAGGRKAIKRAIINKLLLKKKPKDEDIAAIGAITEEADEDQEATAAEEAADETGIEIGNESIGEDIADMFYAAIEDRLDLIATMELGTAYSDGKFDELDVMNDIDADFDDDTSASDYKQKKTWVAILDDHTREWHAEADGQEVDIDEPFIVMGEELMEPRDDSMGASPENVMNCRCEAEISMS